MTDQPRKVPLQGIFYTKQSGEWLYTVRADVTDGPDVIAKCAELSRRFKNAPVKCRVEDWNFPKSSMDGFFHSTEV